MERGYTRESVEKLAGWIMDVLDVVWMVVARSWFTDSLLYSTSLQNGRIQVYRRVVQEEAVGCPPFPAPCAVRVAKFGKPTILIFIQVLGVPPIECHPPGFPPVSS